MSALFDWIQETPLAAWVYSSAWIWPTLETFHFMSLCVLIGALLVVDLRLMGFYRDACPATIRRLVTLSLAAFAVNVATGVLFFFGNTFKYVGNPAFEIKLLLIAAAGINALYYRTRLARIVETREVTAASIVVGAMSLMLWSGVIVCGRMITFFAR
jgi:hypothetical protein